MVWIILSLPFWFAAAWALFVGLVGTFHSDVQETEKYIASFVLIPLSSVFATVAAAMCGLI